MLKKLTVREASGDQREFAERTAHACGPECRAGCHDPDHFVADFTLNLKP